MNKVLNADLVLWSQRVQANQGRIYTEDKVLVQCCNRLGEVFCGKSNEEHACSTKSCSLEGHIKLCSFLLILLSGLMFCL